MTLEVMASPGDGVTIRGATRSLPVNAPLPRDPTPFPSIGHRELCERLREGPMRRITIGDDELAYWRFGRGPDLLLVHGWPLHAATFRALVPALAEHFTCHLFDLPGCGHTRSRTDGPLGFAEHTATLAALVDALALDRYALLAHDSGAVFARLLAAEHGDRVQALVIGNTEIPGHRPPVVELLCAMARMPGGAGLLRTMMRMRAFRRSRLGFRGCFTDPAFVDGEFAQWFVAPMLASRTVTRGQLRLARGIDFRVIDGLVPVHRRIVAPVCMIWGERDPFFPLALARALPEQFGGAAELRVIPGAKLFAHEDHPAAFLAHALPFLRDTCQLDHGL
jgi:haloalkane dehalogenase